MSTYDTMLITIWKAVCGGVCVCVCACVWVCGLLNRLAQEIAEKISWKVTESGLKVELVFGSAHECLTLVRSIPSTHHSRHTNCHSSIMNRSFVWPPFLTRSLSLSHTLLQMLLKWLFFSLCIMPAMFSNTRRKCPTECNCSFDELDRYQAICTKGKWRNKCEKRTIKRTSNYRARTRKKKEKRKLYPNPTRSMGKGKCVQIMQYS